MQTYYVLVTDEDTNQVFVYENQSSTSQEAMEKVALEIKSDPDLIYELDIVAAFPATISDVDDIQTWFNEGYRHYVESETSSEGPAQDA